MFTKLKSLAAKVAGNLALGLLVPVILLLPTTASAALGGDVTSVQSDQVHMQGSLRTTQTDGYTVHEIKAATGTVVREYVSPAGKVFAVAWEGPWLPDIKQLLGAYFDQFAQAAQTQANARTGRRPLHIEQSGLVVDLTGHMRAFAGRAYVPEMLPQAVRAEEIR
jgi:uncharacterized protein DUF2844